MAFTTLPGGITADKFLTDLKEVLISPWGILCGPFSGWRRGRYQYRASRKTSVRSFISIYKLENTSICFCLQARRPVVKRFHGMTYIVGIHPVLLSSLHRPLQLRYNRLTQITRQLPGTFREIIHRTCNLSTDLLNIVSRFSAGIGQLAGRQAS